MNLNDPIGVFDSGVGGTSIWKEIHGLLPFEHTYYLADSRNAPYGNRSSDEIVALSIKNTEKLISLGSKIIVVACNTATTNAISVLRSNFDLPIIGIEPAIKPAALHTKTGSIGILATKGTLSSKLFHTTSALFARDISVLEIVGEGLVALIEEGDLNSPKLKSLLQAYLNPMIEANIDHLVLGCSHYPYLIPLLRELLPESVKIIDSGEAVAKQTKTLLEEDKLLRKERTKPKLQFYTNSDTSTLEYLLQSYGGSIQIEQHDF